MSENQQHGIQQNGHVNKNRYGHGVSWLRGSMIGKGSFGCVYLATHKNTTSKYSCFPHLMAVKSAEVSASSSIQKEREVLSNLKGCSDIIRCFGEETTVGDNGAIVYNLLLEYGSGGTLADRIKNSESGLPEFEVKAYARSILRGLSHVHSIGYVHCDLKPNNILLVRDNKGSIAEFRVKIADFGLAKRAKQSKKRKLEEPYSCYWAGTPMYLSPEAVVDRVQDFPCDIWAFGCIVLEMLTGKPPWSVEGKEMSAEEILGKIRAGGELPEIPKGVSKEARDFLKGCFVRKPVYRLTAEMLLNHPFVAGNLEGGDGVAENEGVLLEGFRDLDEMESMLLVCGSDSEVSCWSDDEDSIYCLSGEYEDDVEDEIASVISEEREFDRSKDKKRKVSLENGERFPVSFTIPAGV